MESNTRRNFVKTTCIAGGLGLFSSVSARTQTGESETASLPGTRVSGKMVVKNTFYKDRVEVDVTYKSRDLVERRGRPEFSKTKEIARPAPHEDDLPLRGQQTSVEPWHTYMASESEWRAISKHSIDLADEQGAAPQDDHPPEEDELCGIGIWDYEKDGSDYYIKSPMNIICKGFDVEDVEAILSDEGWYDEHAFTADWKRYAWDKDREIFVGPDNEPQGAYSHAVSHRFGFLGRKHAKFWELEDGIVSIQAHEDGNAPDHSTGLEYDPGRESVVALLTDNGGSDDGFQYLDNAKKDHSGSARVVTGNFDSIDRSC